MKYIFVLLGTLFLLVCLSLFILWGLTARKSKLLQQEARQGLDRVVADELPTLEGFEITKVASFESSNTVYDETCYYASDYLILGGSLTEEDALNRYAAKLESSGWTPRRRQYPTSKVFMYGDYVQLNIRTGDIDPGLDNYVDYEKMREIYPSIIFIRITFMLPKREGC